MAYRIWIVEETEPFSGLATLTPGEFLTDHLDAAQAWAGAFNAAELTEPVGAWAVIRRQ